MEGEQGFENMLTSKEIDEEIAKVADFFKRIPDDLKAVAAVRFILEIVNQGSRDYFQAIGLFDEAKFNFRDSALAIRMDDDEDLLDVAFESSQNFCCIKEIKWGQGHSVISGEICKVGYVGEDARYTGGERFEVFQEDGQHFSICRDVFEQCFEEVNNIT